MARSISAIIVACALALAGCTPSGSADVKQDAQASSGRIASISAGTKRTAAGRIADERTSFKATDHVLVFDILTTDITEPTTVEINWFIEHDTGPFSRHAVTVTPDAPLVQLELPRDNDWPEGTYTVLVGLGNTSKKIEKSFQYDITR